jgi:MFS family permease
VPGLVAARLVLGVGEGCVFTAGATWAVDLSNEENRGRILGLFGLAIWSALAAGPLLGQILLDNVSYDAVWAVACAAPLAAALLARSLPESPVVPRPGAERVPFLPRPTLRPGLALTLASIGHATFASFIVLHTAKQGIGHGAAVFAAFATAVVGARLLGGNLPDIVGPRRTAVAAAGAEAAGLVVIAQAHTLATAIIGSLVMGVGFSVLFPSLALLAVNEVGDAGRGAALGAVTAFFDVGQGIGGPIAGAISSAAGYGTAFMVAAVAAAAGGTVAALGAPRVRARVDAMRA